MTKRLLILFTLILLNMKVSGQSPAWTWVNGYGGIDMDYSNDVVIDTANCIYQSGTFRSPNLQIDTSLLQTNFQSSFIIKYNALGEVVWTMQIGKERTVIGKKCLDSEGNLYVRGEFLDSILVIDQDTLINPGFQQFNYSNFICKFNSDNQLQWCNTFFLSDSLVFFDMDVDENENLYITGEFQAHQIILGNDTLTKDSSFFANAFILKLDSLRNYKWAKIIHGNVSASSCKIDRNNDIIIGGVLSSGVLIYDSDTINSNGASDVYVMKVDSIGEKIFINNFGGSSYEILENLEVDRNGNIYLTGSFYGNDFIAGSTTLTNIGGADAFALGLSENGISKWIQSVGDTSDEFGTSISIDLNGNVFWTGNFRSDSIILNGMLYYNAGLNSLDDFFMEKIDSLGAIIWAYGFGSEGVDFNPIFSCDNQNELYFSSNFSGSTIDFSGVQLINNGSHDFFIAKLDIPLLTNQVDLGITKLYPNPSAGIFKIQSSMFKGNLNFILSNIEGKILSKGILQKDYFGNYILDINNFNDGFYLLILSDGKSNQGYRICKF